MEIKICVLREETNLGGVQAKLAIITEERSLLDITSNLVSCRIGLWRAKCRRLVAAVLAVEVAVTLPAGGDALARGAGELGATDAGAKATWIEGGD